MTPPNLLCFAVIILTFGDVMCLREGALRVYYRHYAATSYGRLEMYYRWKWIPFTIDGFDMHDADLACRELGYLHASRYAVVGTFEYPEATTKYSVSRVQCPRQVTSFGRCSHQTVYSNSYHHKDVGLQCTNSKTPIRLVSSGGKPDAVHSGRLQVFINNTWGTVCDDDFGTVPGEVACRQLGYSGYAKHSNAGSLKSYSSSLTVPIWLDNLDNCASSSKSDLRKCTNAVGISDCTHRDDVVLTCKGELSSDSSAGLAVGVVIATLVFLSIIMVVTPVCIVIAVLKCGCKRSSPRIVNVVGDNRTAYEMSGATARASGGNLAPPVAARVSYSCNDQPTWFSEAPPAYETCHGKYGHHVGPTPDVSKDEDENSVDSFQVSNEDEPLISFGDKLQA